ncbi:MAG: protein kinase [Xenococcus sp. MO_188.B8]|nr:protein kinase [Xenococcus sp. MO_188.B8]
MNRKPKFFIPRSDKRLGDRYELLECLGDGSYGWVWRTQRLEDDRIVALKIPKRQGAKNNDLAEGSALVGAQPHPNVIEIYWMGRVPPEREWYAIEMEYFPSQTFAQLLDKETQGFVASYKKVLDIYQQVLAGVGHLHSLGMCHGDIKPQNILVSGDQAKLTDFGCSLLPEELYARTRENGGTILYSAPEIVGSNLKRRSADTLFKADIYSLGILLYHLVTARLPHDTLSQVARHMPFPKPREINSSVSPVLENFILRCLAFKPEERWSTVAEMVSILPKLVRSQINFNPTSIISVRSKPQEDWSSQVLKLLSQQEYSQAEAIAYCEFENSKDSYAFFLALSAFYQDERYFDCLQKIEAYPEVFTTESSILGDLYRIALNTYIQTRQIDKAENAIARCLAIEGNLPDLLLQKASILGSQAKYQKAAELLLSLNRDYPGNPAILKRLILVFEQLRDTGKVIAFLKAYLKIIPEDIWGQRKLQDLNILRSR